jgi:outer membrane protein assembly factor BamE (lipoprotein component of BamABCDE complex)
VRYSYLPKDIPSAPLGGSLLSMRRPIATIVITATLAVATVACAPRTANRGNIPTVSQLEKLKVGKHSKEYVRGLLGTPSTVGTFDKDVWYYIGRRIEKWAFLEENILEQQIVAVYFDPKGTIEHLQIYDKDDSREIAIVDGKTATSGHELGVFEQIIGNLGRFNRKGSSTTYRY